VCVCTPALIATGGVCTLQFGNQVGVLLDVAVLSCSQYRALLALTYDVGPHVLQTTQSWHLSMVAKQHHLFNAKPCIVE
jgi:hypothetical protein